ncbi:MAG: flavodoxin family protein [Acidobacteriota bacterium]
MTPPPTTRMLIAYATDHGTTRQVAQAITEGAGDSEGCCAEARDVEYLRSDDLRQVDALILGAPVHMGGCHWAMKQFIDRILGPLWASSELEGRVGALFATGSGRGGAGAGAELNMLSMLAVLAEMGMILVPLPHQTAGYESGGLHWGPFFRTGVENGRPVLLDRDLTAARRHGHRVALVTRQINPLHFGASASREEP